MFYNMVCICRVYGKFHVMIEIRKNEKSMEISGHDESEFLAFLDAPFFSFFFTLSDHDNRSLFFGFLCEFYKNY